MKIYEYGQEQNDKNTGDDLIFETVLNEHYHCVYIRDSKIVLANGKLIYFIQIVEDLSENTVAVNLCSFDLISKKKNIEKTETQEIRNNQFIVGGVFGEVNLEGESLNPSEFLERQYIALVYTFANVMRYRIRRCTDFETDMTE